MVNLVDVFREGGAFQFAVLPTAMLAILVCLFVPGVIGLAKWRVPASLSLTALLLPLGVGLVGTLMGMQATWNALAIAPADIADSLMAAGSSIAPYPVLLAVVLLIAAPVAACFSGAVPAVVAVGPNARFDVRGLLSAASGAFVAAIVVVALLAAVVGVRALVDSQVGLVAAISLTLFVTPLTIVACGRISDDDQLHQGRVAGSRFFVALCGALALVLLGEALRLSGLCMAGRSVALAAPEVQARLTFMGLEYASTGAWIGWLFALIPLTAGTLGSLHWVRRIDGRVGIGAGIALFCVVAILVMLLVTRLTSVLQIPGLA